MNTGNWEEDFNFVKELGSTTLNIIKETVSNKKDLDWTEEEKEQQLIKRGRYVEFNLIYDRGTLFGLRSGGRIESIFMSLPPEVEFHYNWQPESGSAQEKMLSYYQPYDWING